MEESLRICSKVYAFVVFASRKSNYKFTNQPEALLNIYRDNREGTYTKQMSQVFKKYAETEEDKNYLREALDFIENSIKTYFSSEKDFMDRVIVNYEKEVAPRLRANDRILDFYRAINPETRKKRGIDRRDGEQVIRTHVEQENKRLQEEQDKLAKKEEKKQNLLKKLAQEIAKDFKDPEVKPHSLEELAQPKDKWKRGKKLLDVQKKFPHDLVLQRMIKDEFKENRVFKYPEEYEIYDDEEEEKRKMPKYKVYGVQERKERDQDKEERQKQLIEKFLVQESLREQTKKMQEDQRKHRLKEFNLAMKQEVEAYIEEAKNRLTQKREKGQRERIAEVFNRLKTSYADVMDEKYPHPMYGIKKGSKVEKMSFPQKFKYDFYELYRKIKKRGRATSTRPAYFVPGGVSHGSHNAKITLGEDVMKKYEKPQPGVKTRVWKRDDYQSVMHEIMMTQDDAENCRFEPNAGSQNPHMKKILATHPEFEREGYNQEKTLKDFVDRLGDKFSVSNPEIFKAGILKKAQSLFSAGEIEEALRKLSEGFKFSSLQREYDPKYAIKQEMRRQKLEQLKAKEKEGKKMPELPKSYEERFENQKDMREEQFGKKKLEPILLEAFELLSRIEAIDEERKKEKLKFKNLVKERNKQLNEEIKKKEEEYQKKKREERRREEAERKKREEEQAKEERKQKRLAAKKQKEEEERKKEIAKKLKEERKNVFKIAVDKHQKRAQSSKVKKMLNKDLA